MGMKIRIIFKRNIQPPIDTPAGIEHKTLEFYVGEEWENWLTGKDCESCSVWSTAVGYEIIKDNLTPSSDG